MKISFLQNLNIYKNKQKDRVSFCSQHHNLQRTPKKDVFVSSKRKEKFIEEQMLDYIEGSKDFIDESKEMLKATFAGSYYLNEARENLPLLKSGAYSFEGFSERTLSKIGPKYREGLQTALKEAGITNLQSLIDIAQIYEALFKKQADAISHGKAIIEIYGLLNDPKDLVNFSGILDEINFQNEYFYSAIDYNDAVEWAKFFGVKNEDEFFKKFSHLKNEFNGFETPDDKFNAFEFTRNTYSIKKEGMLIAQDSLPILNNLDLDEFYKNNADIVDYLFIHNQKNCLDMLRKIMVYTTLQEPISPNAMNCVSDILDTKTPKGKIELYDFLINEEITATELNAMARQTYYEGIKISDVILNRTEIIAGMMDLFNAPETQKRAFYACFAQTLNVINNENEKVFILDPTSNLIEALNAFGISDEGEFVKFYSNVMKNNTQSSKNKKGQQKISQKDILNFIDLLSFLDLSMVEAYREDNKYPLYLELKKKKNEFEKVEKKITQEINKQKVSEYFANPLDIFVEYYDLFKTSKNIEAFVLNATKLRKIELIEMQKANFTTYDTLLYHFKDKNALDKFLEKNHINLTRQTAYESLCIRIIATLFYGKNEKEIQELSQKLSQNNFILNSKKQLAKFANSKTDEELQILFEIILNQNISSIQELNAILKPYLNKQKQISSFLAHFKTQNMDFEAYLNKINQIQRDLTNYGFPIEINNDNIKALNFEELKGNRLNLTQASNLANKILNVGNGNFVAGLDNSQIAMHPKYSAVQMAKELIYSQSGRYKESYKGFLNSYGLSAVNFGFLDAGKIEYQNALQKYLKSNLSGMLAFINSDNWIYHFENGKMPNLSLHAKMRLIDRFILQENKDVFSIDSQKELYEITKVIYSATPYKMEKTNTSFALYFLLNNYEIKAVFDKNGQMLTVAKNKL